MAISIKSAREIELMRAASQVVAEVHALLRQAVRPGVTTRELDRIAHQHILDRGGTPSFLGYHGYPASICTSVNDEIVHGIPGQRVLREGDIVSIDVGVLLNGYHGDAAVTLPVGAVSPEAGALIADTEEAFRIGVAEARVGKRLGDISAAIQEYAESRGYGVVREYSGHGVGREMHEDPQVPNYGRARSGVPLRSGMTLAIEPMLTIGPPDTRVLRDDWTVATASHGLAAHYEHTVWISDDGPVLLTEATDRVI